MSLKSIIRDLKKNIIVNKKKCELLHGKPYMASEESLPSLSASIQQSQWVNLPPELLLDIISRLEVSEISWPARRAVISCAAVCRSWREITKEVVRTPEKSRLLTFPMSLKQPGPRDTPIQCFIKRDIATSTYRLYLGLSPALADRDTSKLLFAAKRIRKAMKTYFVISLAGNDFSQTSNNYAGKLRSNLFRSKFVICDCEPSRSSIIQSHCCTHGKSSTKKVLPRPPDCNYKVATISYDFNVLRSRGPRRIQCTMHTILVSAIQEGVAPPHATFSNSLDIYSSTDSRGKNQNSASISSINSPESVSNSRDPLVLRNKIPRWHEQLQCWCLNFRGRVTVASVKNFQLVAAAHPTLTALAQERVILQFGKIGKDIFTMDYLYPLSAFQAFAMCLSSFDTKPACE